jgi:hypothetical protein
MRINQNAKFGALVAVVATGALMAPSVAPAKTTKKYTVKIQNKSQNGKLTGAISGTFGKGQQTGTSAPPKIVSTWHLKGGTITLYINDGHQQGATVAGSVSKIKGTGKYKKIKQKGKGKISGDFTTSVYTFTGKVTY